MSKTIITPWCEASLATYTLTVFCMYVCVYRYVCVYICMYVYVVVIKRVYPQVFFGETDIVRTLSSHPSAWPEFGFKITAVPARALCDLLGTEASLRISIKSRNKQVLT